MLSKLRNVIRPSKGTHHHRVEQESSTPSTPSFETPIHDHFVSPGWMYRNVKRFSTPKFQPRESPTKVADRTDDAVMKGHEVQKKDNHKPNGSNIYMNRKDERRGVQFDTSDSVSPKGEQNIPLHDSESRFRSLRNAFTTRNRKAGSNFTSLQTSHTQRDRKPESPVILRKPVYTQVQYPGEVSLLPEEDSAIQWVMPLDSPTSGTSSGPTAVESDQQSLEISEDIPSSDEILASDEPSYGMALRNRHGLRQPGYLRYNSFFQEYCAKAWGSSWTVDTHDSNWVSFGPILRRRPGPRTPFRHSLSKRTSLRGMYRGMKGKFESVRSKMKRW